MAIDHLTATDLELLDAFKHGDALALEELYRRYRERVFTYLLTLLAVREEAEDTLQELWLSIIRNAVQLNTEGNFACLLFTSARNLALNRIARRSREKQILAAAERPLAAPEGDRRTAELAEQVCAELARLPDEQREALVLKICSNLTFAELAQITGVPLGTAMSRYRSAVEKLRERLSPNAD